MKKIVCIFFLILAMLPIFADENKAETNENFNIRGSGKFFALDPLTDGILLGTGLLLTGGELLLDDMLELNRRKYDGTVYSKSDVNAFDRELIRPYSEIHDGAADFLLIASLTTPVILLSSDKEEWFTNGVMYIETLLIANGLKELAKLAVNRKRPYMYSDRDLPQDEIDNGDWAKSMPSGHTTFAFASAAFLTYTFCRYFPDSPWRIPVSIGSYALASGIAVLRISSGKHFLSDVLAGAAIGSAVGFLVPFLHTLKTKNDMSVAVTGNGLSFTMKF
ncbi:phosphatase PAP2 family protein [bacterium]|nr:phosphatase PAP2 family protein [bacterium]